MSRFVTDTLDGIEIIRAKDVAKFNPNHDEVGRFATGNGSGGTASPAGRKLTEVQFTPHVAAPGTEGASTLEGAYKGFSLSGDELSTLHKYTNNGYKDMNGMLRGTGTSPYSIESTKLDIEAMDALIERAPQVKSETPIFRVFNAYLVVGLKAGDTYVDKGYMSTTTHNITAKRGKTVRNLIGDIEPTMDVVGRIKPNGHHSGISINHAGEDISPNPKEHEFILPRGTQLKYLGFEKAPSGETIMNFERMNG
jgi:hypothetical protein